MSEKKHGNNRHWDFKRGIKWTIINLFVGYLLASVGEFLIHPYLFPDKFPYGMTSTGVGYYSYTFERFLECFEWNPDSFEKIQIKAGVCSVFVITSVATYFPAGKYSFAKKFRLYFPSVLFVRLKYLLI